MKKFILVLSVALCAVQFAQAQRLIVRMDDLGVTHATNLAIMQCYDEGIGRSAEVMSVCPWFMESANMLKEQAKNTQFIVVSHDKSMIKSASRTIGITQGKGITKVTGIKLSD